MLKQRFILVKTTLCDYFETLSRSKIMAKIFENLGKIPEILNPQEILFLQ